MNEVKMKEEVLYLVPKNALACHSLQILTNNPLTYIKLKQWFCLYNREKFDSRLFLQGDQKSDTHSSPSWLMIEFLGWDSSDSSGILSCCQHAADYIGAEFDVL